MGQASCFNIRFDSLMSNSIFISLVIEAMRWNESEDVGIVSTANAYAETCVEELAGELRAFAEAVDYVEGGGV